MLMSSNKVQTQSKVLNTKKSVNGKKVEGINRAWENEDSFKSNQSKSKRRCLDHYFLKFHDNGNQKAREQNTM